MCITRVPSWRVYVLVRHRVVTLLYLVKCLLFASIVSAVFITGVVGEGISILRTLIEHCGQLPKYQIFKILIVH